MDNTQVKNPTLETQSKSVGTQDNSTKPVETMVSKEAFMHNFSTNEESNGIITKSSLSGKLMPTGRKDLNGNPTYKRGPFDYRFGFYVEHNENGEAIPPSELWTDEDKNKKIEGAQIHYDQPVRINGEKILDDQGREWLFWCY